MAENNVKTVRLNADELVKAFAANDSKRKTPNTRFSEESFFAISNRGADVLTELFLKEADL